MSESLCENGSMCDRAGEHPLSDHDEPMPAHDHVQRRRRELWRDRWWAVERWLHRLFRVGVTIGVWLLIVVLWHEHVRIH